MSAAARPSEQSLSEQSLGRSSLAVAALGTMLALMAFTAPLATLSSTAAGLGADVAGRTWILSSMSIGLVAAVLTAGTIADDVGRRRIFVVGSLVLALGSVAAALVPHVLPFVLARVVQGVGAAAIIASSLGIIAHAFPAGPGRAAASGVWGASVGAGIAIGPVLSAALDRTGTWRGIYWLLALGGVGVALLARSRVAESRSEWPRGLDLWGAILLAAGMTALLAVLVEGRTGWGRTEVVLLAVVAVALLAGFIVVEARGHSSMIDLALLTHPPFAAATVAALATGAGSIGLMSFIAAFLGLALGISALASAAVLLVWSVTSVLTALLARRIPARVPGRVQLGVGLLGVAVGQLALGGVGPETTWTHFVPGLLVSGVAAGVVNAALGREAVASVPSERSGMGSGANNTARYLGSAIGVTIVAVLATRPGPGSQLASLLHGWNVAVVVTAAISIAGGLAVLACRPRRRARPVPPSTRLACEVPTTAGQG